MAKTFPSSGLPGFLLAERANRGVRSWMLLARPQLRAKSRAPIQSEILGIENQGKSET